MAWVRRYLLALSGGCQTSVRLRQPPRKTASGTRKQISTALANPNCKSSTHIGAQTFLGGMRKLQRRSDKVLRQAPWCLIVVGKLIWLPAQTRSRRFSWSRTDALRKTCDNQTTSSIKPNTPEFPHSCQKSNSITTWSLPLHYRSSTPRKTIPLSRILELCKNKSLRATSIRFTRTLVKTVSQSRKRMKNTSSKSNLDHLLHRC